MTKPSNFIQSSDYASLKNDAKGTFTLAIGDSGLLAYGASKTYSSTLTIGTINSGLRCQMKSDLSADVWCSSSILAPVTVTSYSGGSLVDTFTFNLPVVIERISATQIKMKATFYSYGEGVDMRITGNYQTITADIVTFLSPFN
jgi:hypothetical protein